MESVSHNTYDLLNAVVDQSIAGIYVIEDGRFTFVNPRMTKMFGYSPGEILGKAVPELVVEADRALVMENIRKRISGEAQSIQYEFCGRRKNGTTLDVCVQGSVADIDGHRAVVGVVQDISKDKEIQRAMVDSERRYREMYLGNPQPMWVFDPKTLRFLSVNDAAVSRYGWSREEFLAMTIADIRPPEDKQRLLAQVLRDGNDEFVDAGEWKHRTKNGEIIDVEITAHSINFDGRKCRVINAHDITERKRARLALEEREERFRAMVENASDLIVTIDGQGVIIYTTPSLIGIGGYAPREVVGRSIMDFTLPEDASAAAQALADVLQNPLEPRRAELRWRHKDGRVIQLESVAKNELANPALRAIVINARDVTVRRHIESGLRESEQRFRAVLEQSLAAMYVIQDGLIVYLNPRMREIFGYRPDEIFESDPLVHVKDTDRPKVIEQMRRRLSGEGQAAYSILALRKDGSEFTLGVHATLAKYEGKPAIIAIAQDITERAFAEAEVKRYVVRLERAMQSTIDVVATIGEQRDPYTHGHERRVGELAAAIGVELGLDANRVEGIRVAGYLHDVGKIGIPAEILAKPTKLSQVEFDLIKGHAQGSYEILKSVEFGWPVAQVALQHHERLDGSGYPQGLKGDAIILEARIMSVADVIEAMSSHRPYRPGLGIDKALAEIERGRGTLYDTVVVDACLRLFRDKSYTIPA